LEFFAANSSKPTAEFVALCAENESFWGQNLGALENFCDTVAHSLTRIEKIGAKAAMREAAGE
jgi:hypothetical protein